jgi:hypothetical protein
MKKINALFFVLILSISNCVKIKNFKNDNNLTKNLKLEEYINKLKTFLTYAKFILNDEIKSQLAENNFSQSPKIANRFVSELLEALTTNKNMKIPLLNNIEKNQINEYLNFAEGLLSNLENNNIDLYNVLLETCEKLSSLLILSVEQLYLPSINKMFKILNIKKNTKNLSNSLKKINKNDFIKIINQTENQIKNNQINISLIQLNSNEKQQFKNFVSVNELIVAVFSVTTLTAFISVLE